MFIQFNSPGFAQTIRFEDVLKQALQKDYDIKLAEIDTLMSQADVKAKRADFYPTLSFHSYSEYLSDFGANNPSIPTTVVGQTIITSGSRYQHAISLNATYTAFDFGARKKQLEGAKKDVLAKAKIAAQTTRDLELKLVDLYADALSTYHQIQTQSAILPIQQALFEISKRLYNAGKTSKVAMAEDAINLAQTLTDTDQLKRHYTETLTSLSYYTHQQYNPQDTEIADFNSEINTDIPTLEETRLPEYQNYALQIAEQQDALSALKRQLLPVFGLYTNYNLYGANPSNLIQSINDIRDRNIAVGFSAVMTLFDGFKNSAQQDKIKLQIERLETERDEKIAEFKSNYNKERLAYDNAQVTIQHQEEAVNETQSKLDMIQRLSEQQLVDKLEILHTQRDVLQRQSDADLLHFKRIASLKKLKIMTES